MLLKSVFGARASNFDSKDESHTQHRFKQPFAGGFETASHKLARLNTLVVVARGWRTSAGPGYDVFEVL
jgi:hypothetical protein